MQLLRRVLIGSAIVAAAAVLVTLFLLGCTCGGTTAITAARFSALRSDPTDLRAFLGRMPKGADLHVHLSGAVYAEDLIAWAKNRNLCVQQAAKIVACSEPDSQPVADAFAKQALYDDLVDALSMRFFLPNAENPSGHDQFFATFGKFGGVTWLIPAEMTAAMLRHDAADGVQHTELMISLLPSDYAPKLLAAIAGVTDSEERLKRLKEGDLDRAVDEAKQAVDGLVQRVDDILGCDEKRTQPGCNVSFRYIAQVNRNANEADVFVQTAFAAALVRADPRVAGLNFVGPEDYRVAREDYHRHMAMIGFLAKDVPVALHAGELWLGLVPPDDLTFHIREAVEVAGARRIGHGVALSFERRSEQLLTEMRDKKVAVEINLTSNDVILGVRGKDHPLMAYRAARVPVVLSTDDAGVSRIDLTNEYVRAARDYPLGYRDLKEIARNSIAYSFLSGDARQNAFKQLDQSFADFERAVAAEHSFASNVGTWIAGLSRSP